MVLLKTTLTGVCLALFGLTLLLVLSPYITVQVRDVQARQVEPHAEFLVGDLRDQPYNLPGGVLVFGTVDVTQAPTNSSGDIRFIVFDADNYQKWTAGQQANFLFSSDTGGEFNFTLTTGNAGMYHFVFDNHASLFKKYISLSVGYKEVIVNNVPDPRVPYFAWPLLAGGGLILAFGLVKKPPISWA
jgi:hypothetical protein